MPSVTNEQADGECENVIQNGPIAQDVRKSKEKAHTLSALRQSAKKWSLADDAGLLEFLKQFSTEMLLKARETTIGVNTLVHDTKMTDVKLRNVTDRFLVLSDSQFIENRVYDEDPNEKSKGKTKNTENGNESSSNVEADTHNKLTEAIKSGLQVLDNAFEVLDVNAANSDFDSDLDSEEEENSHEKSPSHTQAIYEPKDPYVSRPLPHLIGSRGFYEEPGVGITDLPSEDEVQDEDQGSISESDEEVEERKVNEDSESDSSDYDSDGYLSDKVENVEPSRKNTSDSCAFSKSSSDEDEELFAEKLSDGSVSDEDTNNVKRKSSDASKTNKRKSTAKKVSKPHKNMFAAEEDDNDLFAGSGGLFGTGKNLFQRENKGGLFDDIEDSEEENSDFSENADDKNRESELEDIEEKEEEPKVTKPATKKYGGVSVFGDAIGKDFFGKKKPTEEQEEVLSHTSSSSTKKKVDLFDESDDDEDDLFSEKKSPAKKSKAASISSGNKTKQKSKTSLFDSSSSEENDEHPSSRKVTKKLPPKSSDLFGSDSEDDMFMETESSKKKASKPFGGVSIFGKGGESIVESLSKRNQENTAEPKAPNEKEDIDSDNDSMFSEKAQSLEKSSETKAKVKLGGLFDDDSDDANDFFSPAPKKNIQKTTKASIFSDSDDDDFFSTATKSKAVSNRDTEEVPPESPVIPHETKTTDETGKDKDLFKSSSEEEDEMPVKRKPVGAVPMFLQTVGGAELAAAISKRRSNSSAEESSDKSEGNAVLTDSKTTAISLKPSEKPLVNVTAKPFKPFSPLSDVKIQAPRKSPNFLKDLNTKLGIDNSAHQKKPAPLPIEISFDKPPNVNTLESINKTRARGQANRRPPSRHRKLAAPSQRSPMEANVIEKVTHSVDIKEDSGDAALARKNDDVDMKVDTLLPTDADDVIEATVPKPSVLKTDDFEELDKELFSGSLFEKSTTHGKSSKVVSPKLFDDDIFGTDDILDFKIDHRKPKPKPTKSQSDELFGDFNIEKNVKKNTEIFHDDDEEDIFSLEKDLSLPSGKQVKQKNAADSAKKKIIAPTDDIFGGDDDDIFGAESITAKNSLEQTESKKTDMKKGGLFSDEDDGDKDILITKTNPPAEAQSKKPASKVKSKSIFGDDDIDDIFLTTRKSKTTSKKKTSKKKIKKPTEEPGSSIFDDPLSLP